MSCDREISMTRRSQEDVAHVQTVPDKFLMDRLSCAQKVLCSFYAVGISVVFYNLIHNIEFLVSCFWPLLKI